MPNLEQSIEIAYETANKFMRQLEQQDLQKYEIDRLSGAVNGAAAVARALELLRESHQFKVTSRKIAANTNRIACLEEQIATLRNEILKLEKENVTESRTSLPKL